MISVLLADDHRIVRAGLRRLIEDSGKMAVIAEAADGREAIDKAREKIPDVAVIDISMPGLDGLEVVSQLHHYCPDLPILILSMHEEEQYVIRAFEAGAMGYITKRSAPEQLVKAIQKVHSGSRYLTEAAAETLALRLAKGKGCSACYDSGFKGRSGIHELLEMDQALQSLILTNPTIEDLQDHLREKEYRSLKDMGYSKVIEGKTTIEEVTRVAFVEM